MPRSRGGYAGCRGSETQPLAAAGAAYRSDPGRSDLGEGLIFSGVFHVEEHVVIGFFKGETVAASIPAMGGGGIVGLLSVVLYLSRS